jgi:hypothetical protein
LLIILKKKRNLAYQVEKWQRDLTLEDGQLSEEDGPLSALLLQSMKAKAVSWQPMINPTT